MSRDNIPDWEDMPDGVSLATLSWEDVYIKACEWMGRNPTRDEIFDMFDEMASSMRNAVQDDMPAQLDTLISEIVTECLKSKKYHISIMSDEELASKKYCHKCQEVQETYWELSTCDKNLEGLSSEPKDHGNDEDGIIMCSDAWCNPTLQTIETQLITKEFVHTHNMDEKCVECHHMLESAGPQEDVPKKVLGPCPHGVLDVDECLYCEKESACETCSGRGYRKQDRETIRMFGAIQCDDCNGTGVIQ